MNIYACTYVCKQKNMINMLDVSDYDISWWRLSHLNEDHNNLNCHYLVKSTSHYGYVSQFTSFRASQGIIIKYAIIIIIMISAHFVNMLVCDYDNICKDNDFE